MKIFSVFAGLLGAASTVWLLTRFGLGGVMGLIAEDGWGLGIVFVFHAFQVLLSALSWKIVAGTCPADAPAGTLRLRDFVALRCVREGVNNLLPVAQVGGEVVSARLLGRRGLGVRRSAAATICDLTIELLTQVIFTLVGLALLLGSVGETRIIDQFAISAAIALVIAAGMIAAQWLGAISLMEALLVRIAAHLGWSGIEGIRGLNAEVISLYKCRDNAIRAGVAQFAGWALGAGEVFIILHFMGQGRSLEAGFVIEAVGQAAKSAGFAVPGALGVSEGGYILVGGMFGLSPAASIALSLIKRMREIVWGLPSLMLWQWLEHAWRPRPTGAECKEGLGARRAAP